MVFDKCGGKSWIWGNGCKGELFLHHSRRWEGDFNYPKRFGDFTSSLLITKKLIILYIYRYISCNNIKLKRNYN